MNAELTNEVDRIVSETIEDCDLTPDSLRTWTQRMAAVADGMVHHDVVGTLCVACAEIADEAESRTPAWFAVMGTILEYWPEISADPKSNGSTLDEIRKCGEVADRWLARQTT